MNGSHIIAELYECDIERLDDPQWLERALREAAARAGAEVVGVLVHPFAPHGTTGVALLKESHLSVHTWPEHAYAAIDAFTCGDTNPSLAIDSLKESFGAGRIERVTLERGMKGIRLSERR